MKTFAAVLAALSITAAVGCSDQQEPGPGPAEKAGKQIDQAVETAGQKTHDALEKAQGYTSEKMQEAGKAIEQAGEKLQK